MAIQSKQNDWIHTSILYPNRHRWKSLRVFRLRRYCHPSLYHSQLFASTLLWNGGQHACHRHRWLRVIPYPLRPTNVLWALITAIGIYFSMWPILLAAAIDVNETKMKNNKHIHTLIHDIHIVTPSKKGDNYLFLNTKFTITPFIQAPTERNLIRFTVADVLTNTMAFVIVTAAWKISTISRYGTTTHTRIQFMWWFDGGHKIGRIGTLYKYWIADTWRRRFISRC